MMALRESRRASVVLLFLLLLLETSLSFHGASATWGLSLALATHHRSILGRRTADTKIPRRSSTTTTLLYAEKATSKAKKSSGVYSRPSAAIERGSGFFVPGLEGAKVRLVGGVLLLALTALNHSVGSASSSAGNTFAEGLAAIFGLLVLFQAAIEFTKETTLLGGGGSTENVVIGSTSNTSRIPDGGGTSTSTTTLQQVWSVPPMDEAWKTRVEWAASSYLALTPATDVLLVGPGKVVYSLVRQQQANKDKSLFGSDSVESAATTAALETLSQSTSGRVSLPLTHPALQGLADEIIATRRCAVLQRVGDDTGLCWLVLSDQLLASFTKQDLRWLGRLAVYVEP